MLDSFKNISNSNGRIPPIFKLKVSTDILESMNIIPNLEQKAIKNPGLKDKISQ